jgi:2-oxopent-4-enoate/cis-2-oxohex-4-enoate hydratase
VEVDACARALAEALETRVPIAPLTARHHDLTVEDAYRISRRFLERRIGSDAVVGKKIGITSAAVQRLLNVESPDFGFLLRSMQRSSGATIELGRLIQPKIEAEIAFVLGRALGRGTDEAAVLAATEWVVPAFEIVDSRIRDWRITLQDTIADNASCGLFVLGHARVHPQHADLRHVVATIRRGGASVATGAAADVMGSPLTAVAWLANALGRLGERLEAGDVVLSGSMTALVPLSPAEVYEADFGVLGSVQVCTA